MAKNIETLYKDMEENSNTFIKILKETEDKINDLLDNYNKLTTNVDMNNNRVIVEIKIFDILL